LLRMSTSSSSQLEPTTLDASTVNLDELRKEAQRQLYRAQKKTAKAIDRVRVCEEKEKAVMEKADATLEELEALPNGDTLRTDAAAEQEREMKLLELVNGLQAATSRESATGDAPPVVAELVGLAAKLGVIAQDGSVSAPVRAPPKPTKPKGPRASTEPRLPYRVFRSESGAEIRVGKQASDNDVLSTDPEHRDGDDWWLHASGCPGSHVVVRARTVGASTLPRDVELDAAVLAANYSKAAKTGNVAVSLCRARQVSKPFGAKPGLVQLNGDVKTVKVDWRKEKHRLERLASTLSARDSA